MSKFKFESSNDKKRVLWVFVPTRSDTYPKLYPKLYPSTVLGPSDPRQGVWKKQDFPLECTLSSCPPTTNNRSSSTSCYYGCCAPGARPAGCHGFLLAADTDGHADTESGTSCECAGFSTCTLGAARCCVAHMVASPKSPYATIFFLPLSH